MGDEPLPRRVGFDLAQIVPCVGGGIIEGRRVADASFEIEHAHRTRGRGAAREVDDADFAGNAGGIRLAPLSFSGVGAYPLRVGLELPPTPAREKFRAEADLLRAGQALNLVAVLPLLTFLAGFADHHRFVPMGFEDVAGHGLDGAEGGRVRFARLQHHEVERANRRDRDESPQAVARMREKGPPPRNPLYNESNYLTTVSLPRWQEMAVKN